MPVVCVCWFPPCGISNTTYIHALHAHNFRRQPGNPKRDDHNMIYIMWLIKYNNKNNTGNRVNNCVFSGLRQTNYIMYCIIVSGSRWSATGRDFTCGLFYPVPRSGAISFLKLGGRQSLMMFLMQAVVVVSYFVARRLKRFFSHQLFIYDNIPHLGLVDVEFCFSSSTSWKWHTA